MKCPKCGYLGFESVERCRNCGYDFSLSPVRPLPELALRTDPAPPRASIEELPLSGTSTSERAAVAHTGWDAIDHVPGADGSPLLASPASGIGRGATVADLPLFSAATGDEAPLIAVPSKPRAPLAVRRATPEGPRRRTVRPRAPMLDLPPAGPEVPVVTESEAPTRLQVETPRDSTSATFASESPPAGLGARVAATVVDLCLLALIDFVVVYFTLRICGLTMADVSLVPKTPLIAFLILQNGGYLVAFNAAGQTLGKMLAGIRVVSTTRDLPLGLSRATLRAAVWIALAVPGGLGFLSAALTPDHRGFHDRCAGTRVIRTLAV